MDNLECTPRRVPRRDFLRIAAAVAAPYVLTGSGFARPAALKVFDAAKFGAVGDGKTLDTAAIQWTIDEAAASGGRSRVLLRGGRKYLSGTLRLRGGIDFHLADDAELVVSIDSKDYSGGALITAREAHGLSFSGTGSVVGRAKEFMTHYDARDEWWRPAAFRPKMFVLTGCRDLEVRGITIREAPEWGLHMVGCEHVLVDRLKIRNLLDVPNCDGIDPDHCRDVEISNCDIVCGDDAIVIKATRQGAAYGPSSKIRVKDCVIETQDAGVKIGTETTQDIHDVRFERCVIKTSSRGLCIQLRDEGNVYDVEFRDIRLVSRYYSEPWWGRGEAISLTAIPRTAQTKLGSMHDIRIRNITAHAENSVRIDGSPESHISNVRLENVSLTMERTTKYPGGVFDNRPTTVQPPVEKHGSPGFHIRHTDNVAIDNCSVKWGTNISDDFSHALEAENVTNLRLSRFKGEAAHPGRDRAIVVPTN